MSTISTVATATITIAASVHITIGIKAIASPRPLITNPAVGTFIILFVALDMEMINSMVILCEVEDMVGP